MAEIREIHALERIAEALETIAKAKSEPVNNGKEKATQVDHQQQNKQKDYIKTLFAMLDDNLGDTKAFVTIQDELGNGEYEEAVARACASWQQLIKLLDSIYFPSAFNNSQPTLMLFTEAQKLTNDVIDALRYLNDQLPPSDDINCALSKALNARSGLSTIASELRDLYKKAGEPVPEAYEAPMMTKPVEWKYFRIQDAIQAVGTTRVILEEAKGMVIVTYPQDPQVVDEFNDLIINSFNPDKWARFIRMADDVEPSVAEVEEFHAKINNAWTAVDKFNKNLRAFLDEHYGTISPFDVGKRISRNVLSDLMYNATFCLWLAAKYPIYTQGALALNREMYGVGAPERNTQDIDYYTEQIGGDQK